eukprot:1235678-Rhodomonas_salina.1
MRATCLRQVFSSLELASLWYRVVGTMYPVPGVVPVCGTSVHVCILLGIPIAVRNLFRSQGTPGTRVPGYCARSQCRNSSSRSPDFA